MDPYRETFLTWNKVAQLYQEKFMDLELYNESYDRFCEHFPQKAPCVLEIGCGPGNITKYLLAKRPDFDIHGIDIAPNMIRLARLNNPTAHFSVLDARELHMLSRPFHGIISGFCFPYLSPSDGLKLLQECHRLLHPEGLLYLSFVDGDPDQSGYISGSSGDRTYFYYYCWMDLAPVLKSVGYKLIDEFAVSYPRINQEDETHMMILLEKE